MTFLNRIGLAALAAVSLALPTSLLAQTWTGTSSTSWDAAGNWSGNAIPSQSSASVIIGTSSPNGTVKSGDLTRDGGTTISGSGSLTVSGKFIFNTASSTSTLGDSGVLTVTTRLINRGIFDISGGTLNVGSADSGTTISGEYFITGSSNIGTINQSGGTVNAWVNRGFFLSDGAGQLGSAYSLTGGTLNVVSNAGYNPANAEDRRLRSVFLGKGGADNNTVGSSGDLLKVAGGTATFSRNAVGGTADLLISANSELRVEGGTVSFNDYSEVRVGYAYSNDSDRSGLVPISGADNNAITISGGELNIVGDTNVVLGYANDGHLDITSGAMTLEGILLLGNSAVSGSEGFVSMSGGSLTIGGLAYNDGEFDFSGGTLKIMGDYSTILGETWFDTSGASGTVSATYDSLNDWTIVAVPEPSTYALALAGILGLLVLRRGRTARRG